MKTNSKSILDNKTAIRVLAVVIAIISWFLTALSDTGTVAATVENVAVKTEQFESTLEELGLNIITIENTSVNVEVSGERVVVGQIKSDDIDVTLQIPNNLTEPGVYELKVIYTGNKNELKETKGEFSVDNFVPSKIKVNLDRIEHRTLDVKVNEVSKIVLQEGLILEKNPTVTPKEVTLSGPKAELDKVEQIVVDLDVTNVLAKSYMPELSVKALDGQGEEIDLEAHHLSIDQEQVQVVVSVLKTKEIPLTIELLNLPRSFPKEQIKYKMSNEKIRIAGPVDAVDRYNELLIGFVDMTEINLQKNSFIMEVNLPESFINLNNILTVSVEFDISNMSETVINLSNVMMINEPDNYEVALVTNHVNNVKIIGNKDIISTLTEEDIVVEVNLAENREITPGQYQVPARISIPTKGMAWATGEYTVVISVAELSDSDATVNE